MVTESALLGHWSWVPAAPRRNPRAAVAVSFEREGGFCESTQERLGAERRAAVSSGSERGPKGVCGRGVGCCAVCRAEQGVRGTGLASRDPPLGCWLRRGGRRGGWAGPVWRARPWSLRIRCAGSSPRAFPNLGLRPPHLPVTFPLGLWGTPEQKRGR